MTRQFFRLRSKVKQAAGKQAEGKPRSGSA